MLPRSPDLRHQVEDEVRLGAGLQEGAFSGQCAFAGRLGTKIIAELAVAGVFPELPVASVEAPQAKPEGLMQVLAVVEADRREQAATETDVR